MKDIRIFWIFLIFNSVDLMFLKFGWKFLSWLPFQPGPRICLNFYDIYNRLRNIQKNVFVFLTVRHYSAQVLLQRNWLKNKLATNS